MSNATTQTNAAGGETTPNHPHTVSFNGTEYLYRVEMSNGNVMLAMSQSNIRQLTITESIHKWWVSAEILLDGRYEHIERNTLHTIGGIDSLCQTTAGAGPAMAGAEDSPRIDEATEQYVLETSREAGLPIGSKLVKPTIGRPRVMDFRGNGRDLVRIHLKPLGEDFSDSNWMYSFLFTVVDRIDAETTEESKTILLRLEEKDFYDMLPSNMEFSSAQLVGTGAGRSAQIDQELAEIDAVFETGDLTERGIDRLTARSTALQIERGNLPPVDASLLTNDQRRVPTDELLWHMLDSWERKFSRGSKPRASYMPTQEEFIGTEGAESRYFYTTGAKSKFFRGLCTVFNHHVPKSETPPILRRERAEQYDEEIYYPRKFVLRDLEYYMKSRDAEGNPKSIERLFFTSHTRQSELVPEPRVPRVDQADTEFNVSSFEESDIVAYQMVPPQGTDNLQAIKNNRQIVYDPTNRVFGINNTQGSTVNTWHCMNDLINRTQLVSGATGGEPVVGPTQQPHRLDANLQEHSAFHDRITYYADTDQTTTLRGKIDLMGSFFFLSNAMTFVVKGMTRREPACWITIAYRDGDRAGVGDDKENVVVGQWFITQLDSMFSGDDFYQRITAVKPWFYRPKVYEEAIAGEFLDDTRSFNQPTTLSPVEAAYV